jgi:hypothetical protein
VLLGLLDCDVVVRGTVAGGHGEVGKSSDHGDEGSNDVVDALGLRIG